MLPIPPWTTTSGFWTPPFSKSSSIGVAGPVQPPCCAACGLSLPPTSWPGSPRPAAPGTAPGDHPLLDQFSDPPPTPDRLLNVNGCSTPPCGLWGFSPGRWRFSTPTRGLYLLHLHPVAVHDPPLYASIEKHGPPSHRGRQGLGAGTFPDLFRVSLPLTLPGIIAGSMLVFLPALSMFYVPDILGGAKSLLVGNFIRNQFLVARDWPFGAAASVLLTVIMGLMLYGYWICQKRVRRTEPA